jgi:dTDP-L-rhamnose 4-epimerase
MIKKILITGGAGFIGSRVAKMLCNKGFKVIVLDNFSSQVHENVSRSIQEISFVNSIIIGDVRSRENLKRAILDVDCIIHLAAETGTGQSMYEISKYTEVNIAGTALILDLLANEKTHSVKKLIVASSRSIYGEGAYECSDHGLVYPESRNILDLEAGQFEVRCPKCQRLPNLVATSENSLLSPASVYAITKKAQEDLCLLSARSIGVECISLRFQNVYGPGQSLSNPYTGILSIFSTRIMNGNDINIFEDGHESRDFVYVDDVVDAIVASVHPNDASGHAINIGSGVPTSVIQVVEHLSEGFGKKINSHISGAFRHGDIRHNYADITKANLLLNWKPLTSFADGIRLFVEWVKEQEVQPDNYDKSIEELKQHGLYK